MLLLDDGIKPCPIHIGTSMIETLHEIKAGSFIFVKPQALAADICTEMITRFEKFDGDQYPGRIGSDLKRNDSIKKSTDLTLTGKNHWQDLDRELFRSLNLALADFKQRYNFFAGRFKDNGYAIQRTDPGGYYHWHIDGDNPEFALRQLVAIWYLNSLSGAGGVTEFHHQEVQITPETGKLLLFPPFWTHLHRGSSVQSGHKYIATTWVEFAN